MLTPTPSEDTISDGITKLRAARERHPKPALTPDEVVTTLHTLRDIMPPDGVETWAGYIFRAQREGLVTADEGNALFGALRLVGSAGGAAKFK